MTRQSAAIGHMSIVTISSKFRERCPPSPTSSAHLVVVGGDVAEESVVLHLAADFFFQQTQAAEDWSSGERLEAIPRCGEA